MAGMFVDDLVLQRSNPNAKHVIQAIGSSSLEKAKKFAQEHVKETQPSVYGSYTEVYNDTSVDIVWIGTPHALHKQNCLDAINHGKPILCEKPFTVNFKEAEEVIAAAKAKGVFIMEGTPSVMLLYYGISVTYKNCSNVDTLLSSCQRITASRASRQSDWRRSSSVL